MVLYQTICSWSQSEVQDGSYRKTELAYNTLRKRIMFVRNYIPNLIQTVDK